MITFDLVGTIYKKTGVMLMDVNEDEYPEVVAFAGYHVNVVDAEEEDIVLYTPYIVEVDTPAREFAGRTSTVHLKFTNRDEWLALGIEIIEVDDLQ